MSDTILLLHLVGGYFFLTKYKITHLKFHRLEGYRLVLTSIAPAAALWGLSSLITLLLSKFFPSIDHLWFRGIGAAFLSMILGYAFALILNKCYVTKDRRLDVIRELIKAKEDPMEMLILNAADEWKTVSITLKNHKVYIGKITSSFNPTTPLNYINLLPFFSGYRDPVTKTMTLILSYEDIYQKIIAKKEVILMDDFQIVLPVDEIMSANIYAKEKHEEAFPE